MPDICLIIPVHNTARYLGEAIESALSQTLVPRQILVVDDGSTDESVQVARRFGDAVTVVMQANAGASVARNNALAMATQPLISFLDADDRLMSDKLEKQAAALAANPQAMLCVCKIRNFWSPELPRDPATPVDVEAQFRMGQVMTWLARRELFDRVGNFDPTKRYGEGPDLYLRVQHAGLPVVQIDDVLVERRLHGANQSRLGVGGADAVMELLARRVSLRKKPS